MSLKDVTVESSHGVERLFIRATAAQKRLITELRENKDKSIRNEENEFRLYNGEKLVKVLNAKTVDLLLSQKFLEYIDPKSNKIHLSTAARR